MIQLSEYEVRQSLQEPVRWPRRSRKVAGVGRMQCKIRYRRRYGAEGKGKD